MSDHEGRGSAIVGMAAVFPGAPDLARYWQNIERGVDAVSELPAGRWDEAFYDPSSSAPDRLYCRRGGFLESPASFDAAAFGIMPIAAEGAEPDQLLALGTAAAALADAGYADRSFARDRAAVIVGRGGYLTAGVARLDQRVRAAEQLARSLRVLLPDVSEEQIAAVKADFQQQLGPCGSDTAIGLVPNLAASRIANRLDLHGAAYTVDGACASSLLAVDHGCRELETRSSDLVVVGGVHLCHDPTFWSVFCQLGALSRSQAIRPFDRRADGLLIGEGVGMLVMKRLADAERDGDRIYAVIRGTGISSDGRAASLMTPSVAGQLMALERAWKVAALEPSTLGLLEAHGTGTPAGDAAEVETSTRFFGRIDGGAPRAVIGSVKSMIGHAMPAAGIAGLIKAALSIHHATLPPTLHCDEPRRDLEGSRFRPIARAEPWEAGGGTRRAAVNAFGFGGINAHVVLEAHGSVSKRPARASVVSAVDERLVLLAAPSTEALAGAIERGELDGRREGSCRLAMFDPTPERRARAAKIVARGEAWRGRDDLWFAPHGLLEDGGKVAFLFPGVDSSFQPRVDDVAKAFDLRLPLPNPSADLMDVGMGIIAVGRILDAALRALQVRPDMIAGHSIGEWSGMIASEMIARGDVDGIIESLAPERVEVPGVAFVAVGAGVAKVLPALEGLGSIALSHDNCPHQVILCGRDEDADIAVTRLTRAGVLCQKLPFRSGYHSPLFADFVAPHRRVLSQVALDTPRTTMWSATTCRPYPEAPEQVRRLAVDHLVQPVRFRELTEALYAAGARVFLQVGTGSLVGFVADTLRGRPHLAVSANVPNRTGMAQLRRVAAALFVEGQPGPLAELDARQAKVRPTSRGQVSISLSVPLVTPTRPLVLEPRSHAPPPGAGAWSPEPGASPLLAEFAAGAQELASARDEVLAAFMRPAGDVPEAPRAASFRRRISVDTHPELVDHTFYRQPEGWSHMEDRYPVVPMTMLMELMMDAARELVPHKTPIGLEGVRAARWLAVAPAVEVGIEARYDGERHVEVAIRGYATGIVELDDAYPDAPLAERGPIEGATPASISAANLYADRWMFHGPAYQGVIDVGVLGAEGIRGTLTSLAAKGGLLDNAGQLLGYWVMQRASVDRLAMPVHLQRCRFFGPQPPPGARLSCDIRVRELTETQVRADVELAHAGRVWAKIDGWSDRRFDSDERVWDVLRFPEQNTITVMQSQGFGLLHQPWRASASRDLLARRYLDERERAAMRQAGPRNQTAFLLERIAAKDCVRQHLWDAGQGPIFPIEIDIEQEAPGVLRARGPRSVDLRVAVAQHETGVAVARVAVGRAVDIAIERLDGEVRRGNTSAARTEVEVDGYLVGWTCQ